MEPYPQPVSPVDAHASSRAHLDWIVTRLGEPDMMTCSEGDLEEFVTQAGRELQRRLLQEQADLRAVGEVREPGVTGSDGVTRRWAEPGHTRLLTTTVGPIEIGRIAYRAPGVGNLHPADSAWDLPPGPYSHPLRRQIAHETATGSTREARETLLRFTGQRVGTRQLMGVTIGAAQDVRAFYQRSTNPPASPGTGPLDLLVMSVDATGVNMIDSALREGTRGRRPSGPRPPSAQLARRDRAGRTRMAQVAAVYDAAPVQRTAADVLPRDAVERAGRVAGPRAVNRRVNASVEHSTTPMVAWLFDQAELRDPGHRRRWVVVVDGANHQLDRIRAEADRRGVEVDTVIDFIHVLEYVWGAAADLHPTHNARAGFVQTTARDLLEGHAPRVIADLRAILRARDESGRTSPGLERAIAYLTAKLDHLDYRVALTLGWPIASGLIEGACRHVVKDRLNITGARWSLAGAEAILLLRAVITNGDFSPYWRFHIEREHQRNHMSRYQSQHSLAA